MKKEEKNTSLFFFWSVVLIHRHHVQCALLHDTHTSSPSSSDVRDCTTCVSEECMYHEEAPKYDLLS
jgi:hypothetical protein